MSIINISNKPCQCRNTGSNSRFNTHFLIRTESLQVLWPTPTHNDCASSEPIYVILIYGQWVDHRPHYPLSWTLNNIYIRLILSFRLSSMLLYRVKVILFKVAFNNILVLSWRSVLLVEESGVPGENVRFDWSVILRIKLVANLIFAILTLKITDQSNRT